MSRCGAPSLAELLELLHGHVVGTPQAVARQVEHDVLHRRGVPRGEHEAVAVDPALARRELHDPPPEAVRQWRATERRPEVPGARLVDHVGGQEPDRVDAESVHGEGRGIPLRRPLLLHALRRRRRFDAARVEPHCSRPAAALAGGSSTAQADLLAPWRPSGAPRPRRRWRRPRHSGEPQSRRRLRATAPRRPPLATGGGFGGGGGRGERPVTAAMQRG
mmetsp:Transcript_142357/g.354764  ORF Transcript_142357/g.354764 Transcript_142357/m.354764 type:complete len:219 (+) Transcript_142357:2256-2912(+)